jgi:hypothetical protein
MRAAATLLTATIAAVAAIAAGPAYAATTRHCGDIATQSRPDAPQNVRALGTSCATARRLARRHYHRIGDGERCDLSRASCTLGAWTCRRSFFGNSGTRVRCSRGADRVRFFYGV